MEEVIITIASISGAALLNFIATKIYNWATNSKKNFVWKNYNSTVQLERIKSNIEFSELKKRTRIVVIDDEEGFPIKLFKNEGYSIDKWDKVEDYKKLEDGFYDIIILDIKGVALHISEDDGLGVLENIKQKNPSQIIIAFSQHSYDLSKAKFWELADEKIAKPSDFLKIRSIIDNLIDKKFRPERYISTLHKILHDNNVSQNEIRKIDKLIANSISNNSKPDWHSKLTLSNDKTELINQVISIGNTILKFFQ